MNNAIYDKMFDEKLRFKDNLVANIVNYLNENTDQYTSYSDVDVIDLSVYTLHSFILAIENPKIWEETVKKEFIEIIGDKTKTLNYINDVIGKISATDDAIADKIAETDFINGGADL